MGATASPKYSKEEVNISGSNEPIMKTLVFEDSHVSCAAGATRKMLCHISRAVFPMSKISCRLLHATVQDFTCRYIGHAARDFILGKCGTRNTGFYLLHGTRNMAEDFTYGALGTRHAAHCTVKMIIISHHSLIIFCLELSLKLKPMVSNFQLNERTPSILRH